MSDSVQNRARVGAKELTALMTLLVSSEAFLSYPSFLTQSALEAAWMEPLVSGALTLVLFLVAERLLRNRFYGMDVLELAKTSLGRGVAVVLGLLFAGYYLATTASVMRQFTENVITTVLPSTPILVVGAVFVLVVWYVAYTGLEGIARCAYLAQPVLIIGSVGLCVLTVNWWHPTFLFPIWGTGPQAVIRGGLRYASVFSNVLLLLVIYPHAHDPKSLRGVGIKSIVLASVLLSSFVLTYCMVFAAEETGKTSFPMYQLARLIYLGHFFQRVESVFVFLWVTAAVVKMSLTLWAAGYLLSSVFSWPNFRPILPALALISFAACLVPDNLMTIVWYEEWSLRTWVWMVVFGLPLVVLFVASGRAGLRRA